MARWHRDAEGRRGELHHASGRDKNGDKGMGGGSNRAETAGDVETTFYIVW